jgi:putative tricarboxylic transport membrane protein
MSEGIGRDGGTGRHGVIRNPQDFWGGVVLVVVALAALWASADLPGQHGFAFGPGTAPRLFAVLLGLVGAAVAGIGLLVDGPALERYAIRGPLLVSAAVFFFALTIRPLGLVISSFATILIAAAASDETRWIETIIWAAAITAFCAFLFPYALNLPLELWPQWLRDAWAHLWS